MCFNFRDMLEVELGAIRGKAELGDIPARELELR
jgi:hypothetical protein